MLHVAASGGQGAHCNQSPCFWISCQYQLWLGHAMVFLFSGVTKRKVTWRRASSPSPSYVVDTALAILQPLYGNAFTMGGPPLGQPVRLFRSVHLDSSRGVVKTVICLFIPAAVTLPPEAFQASLPPSVDAIIKSDSIWRFPL